LSNDAQVTTRGARDMHSGLSNDSTMVLGASGWIGREVFRVACRSGTAVGATRQAGLNGLRAVRDAHDLEQVLKDEDVKTVINCAGRTVGSDAALTQANVAYTHMVGEVCRRSGVRMIHVGSAAEYGGGDEAVVRETAPTQPQSPYGRSKLAGTQALLHLAAQGLDVTVARPFNVIGAGQPLSTPIGEFAEAVRALPASGGDVPVRDSSLVRDFISRTFVADALLRLGQTEGRAALVNVCSGQGLSFADLIQAMADVRGVAIRIINTQPGGIPRVVGDPALLHTLIGPAEVEGAAQLARQALQSAV
jgi:nucleoside-diphosphate-sugar epimerase